MRNTDGYRGIQKSGDLFSDWIRHIIFYEVRSLSVPCKKQSLKWNILSRMAITASINRLFMVF